MTESDGISRSRNDYLLVIALLLPALLPLLGESMFASHDGLHHLYRLFDLDYVLRGGELLPRWLPNLGFGHGYPVLNYYAGLAYVLALPFLALGTGMILATKILYALGFLAAAVGMYRLCRPFVGRAGAVLAATAFTYMPYRLADAYVRGALPEFLAFSLLPLILLELYRGITERSLMHLGGFGLALAALILTHNLSAVLIAPAVVVFALMVWLVGGQRYGLRSTLLAVGMALALTAFYWLPALGEVGMIRASQTARDSSLVSDQLVGLGEAISPYLLYRYYPDQGTPLEQPLSFVPLALAALGLISLGARWRRLRPLQRAWLAACALISLAGLGMLLPISRPLWTHLPGMSYLQFPWRWQVPISLGLAGLIGGVLLLGRRPARRVQVAPQWWHWVLVVALSAGLASTALWRLPRQEQVAPGAEGALVENDVNLAGMAAYEYQLFLATREWKAPWTLEYLPGTVQESPTELLLPPSAPPADAVPPAPLRLEVIRQHPLRWKLRVATEGYSLLRLHSFYFPGWKARLDGQPISVYPSTPLGLLTLDVPAGVHDLEVWFGDTPFRRAGDITSVLALLGIAVWLVKRGRWRAVGLSLALLIVLAGLWGWHSQASTVVEPVAQWANFGDQIALAGYRAAPEPGVSDTLEVDLWWLALHAPGRDYKAFVHLEDAAGRRWSQDDAQPVFTLSPTSRWAANELVRDVHRLTLPADLQEGDYRLYVGWYDAETTANLELLDEQHNPQGQRLLLGTVHLNGL